MAAKNDNITKDPVSAGAKGGKKKGINKSTALKKALGLDNPSNMEQFQKALLTLASEFLTSKDKRVVAFAWKELLKYSFPQQRDVAVSGELNIQTQKIFVIPAFNMDNVSSN